tara:strand:+ start:4255 stop:4983 length:729 start_codon:yes stop_codon:yes gene_type:complete
MKEDYIPFLEKMSRDELVDCVVKSRGRPQDLRAALLRRHIFKLKTVKEHIRLHINLISKTIRNTQPGSIKYLLFGSEPTEQSFSIRMGKIGEEMIKKIITITDNVELLKCGVQCIDIKTRKNKDIDLVWINETNKTIYYREAKGNIELDSEKLPATLDKIEEILYKKFKPEYPDYTIDIGVFNWSVYNRKALKSVPSQIRTIEKRGIKVEHPEDLFKLLNFRWGEKDYYEFWWEIGRSLREE